MNKKEEISKLEEKKYRIMGLQDIKDNLKEEWLLWYKNNSKTPEDLNKIKMVAVAMRRLSNAFSCQEVFTYCQDYDFDSLTQKELMDVIIYFHGMRSEEFANFMRKDRTR